MSASSARPTRRDWAEAPPARPAVATVSEVAQATCEALDGSSSWCESSPRYRCVGGGVRLNADRLPAAVPCRAASRRVLAGRRSGPSARAGRLRRERLVEMARREPRPPAPLSSGSSRGSAPGEGAARVWKRQPDGGLAGLGMSPSSRRRSAPDARVGSGMAAEQGPRVGVQRLARRARRRRRDLDDPAQIHHGDPVADVPDRPRGRGR